MINEFKINAKYDSLVEIVINNSKEVKEHMKS